MKWLLSLVLALGWFPSREANAEDANMEGLDIYRTAHSYVSADTQASLRGPHGWFFIETLPAKSTYEDGLEKRVQRARGGLIASSLVMGLGLGLIGGAAAAAGASEYSEIMPAAGLVLGGSILVIPGVVGVGVCGRRLRTAKKELSELRH